MTQAAGECAACLPFPYCMGERAACCPSVGRPRKGHQLELLSQDTQSLIGGEMQWGASCMMPALVRLVAGQLLTPGRLESRSKNVLFSPSVSNGFVRRERWLPRPSRKLRGRATGRAGGRRIAPGPAAALAPGAPRMCEPCTPDPLLEAVRGLRVADPGLGFKPLLAKLREQQPELEAASKEVREALEALRRR